VHPLSCHCFCSCNRKDPPDPPAAAIAAWAAAWLLLVLLPWATGVQGGSWSVVMACAVTHVQYPSHGCIPCGIRSRPSLSFLLPLAVLLYGTASTPYSTDPRAFQELQSESTAQLEPFNYEKQTNPYFSCLLAVHTQPQKPRLLGYKLLNCC
jgi:hypothetical protein